MLNGSIRISYILLMILSLSLYIILLFWWQSWVIFGIILYIVLSVYFSNKLRDPLNMHLIAISSIFLYAVPSSVLILQGEIVLDRDESLMLFSSICLGLLGYTSGVLVIKKSSIFKHNTRLSVKLNKLLGLLGYTSGVLVIKSSSIFKHNTRLSVKLNRLFWTTYKYRYILVFISCLILFYKGFAPMSMSYQESVDYRAQVPGVVQYYNSLIGTIFSILTLGMISVFGDIKKYRKLSWLSYLTIILIVLSIIGGHRSIIISLCAYLMLAFQPRLKRKYIMLIGILAIMIIFTVSGAVRFARSGISFTYNLRYFYEYFINLKSLISIFWGLSDFTGPFSVFITLVKNIPQNINFDYFAYIKDLSLLIPTLLYPGRPLPYNKWYVATFDPDRFQAGGGLTFYILGFGYLFAGPFGVFIHLFLFGVLFELFNKFFKMVGDPAGIFLYGYFFVNLILFAVSDGFVTFIKNSIILYGIIPISLLFLSAFFLDSLKPK